MGNSDLDDASAGLLELDQELSGEEGSIRLDADPRQGLPAEHLAGAVDIRDPQAEEDQVRQAVGPRVERSHQRVGSLDPIADHHIGIAGRETLNEPSQILDPELAVAVGVPIRVIAKAPSADLWPGQTDEAEAGFSYPELDRLLFWRIDGRRSVEDVTAMGFDPAFVARVERMVAGAEFKRQVPPVAKLGPRTPGVDYLYPRRRPGSART